MHDEMNITQRELTVRTNATCQMQMKIQNLSTFKRLENLNEIRKTTLGGGGLFPTLKRHWKHFEKKTISSSQPCFAQWCIKVNVSQKENGSN